MCGPALAIVGAAASVAQGVAGFSAAQQQADAQNDYYRENARAAQSAAVNSYENLQTRRLQEREAAGQRRTENQVAALEKRSSARAAAAEGGVSGLSVDALIGNLYQQEGRNWMAIKTNYEMTSQNINTEMEGVKTNAQGRINSVRRADNPSPLPFLIQGISGAVGSFRGV